MTAQRSEAVQQSEAVRADRTAVRDIIVIGASAGGVEALRKLVSGLPPDLNAAVFIVLHIPPNGVSVLPEMLSRSGPLPALHPRDGEELRKGRIYVAPPDRHLIVWPGAVRLSAGPRENHSRPAADPLFRSAAISYGTRVIGVVLTGMLSDGAAGLWEIKERGGIAIVQDPGDAAFPSMPHHAMDQVPVDYVRPVVEIPGLLAQLARAPSQETAGDGSESDSGQAEPAVGAPEGVGTMAEQKGERMPDEKPAEREVRRDQAEQVAGHRDGAVTVYVCPECGGSLWQANAGSLLRFRCHVGHVYGGADLLEGYTSELERTLWWAVRSLRDKANLTRQLANNARERGEAGEAARHDEKSRLDDEHADQLLRMLDAAASTNRRP